MGAKVSSLKEENKFKTFSEIVDFIATNYILSMDFQSLQNLSEPTYCDDLVIVTSDIIKKYFTNYDIAGLSERVKNGEDDDKSLNSISYITKDALNRVEKQLQNSFEKKKSMFWNSKVLCENCSYFRSDS